MNTCLPPELILRLQQREKDEKDHMDKFVGILVLGSSPYEVCSHDQISLTAAEIRMNTCLGR